MWRHQVGAGKDAITLYWLGSPWTAKSSLDVDTKIVHWRDLANQCYSFKCLSMVYSLHGLILINGCSTLHNLPPPTALPTTGEPSNLLRYWIPSLGDLMLQRPSACSSRLIEATSIHNATTCISQTLNRPVVTPPSELLLHSLTQHRAVHIRVRRRLRRELLIEIGCVTLVEH